MGNAMLQKEKKKRAAEAEGGGKARQRVTTAIESCICAVEIGHPLALVLLLSRAQEGGRGRGRGFIKLGPKWGLAPGREGYFRGEGDSASFTVLRQLGWSKDDLHGMRRRMPGSGFRSSVSNGLMM